ncbi:hypothetical protein HOLleu_33125 [Holothuria leucospilota]|uniref:Uncharacterized protein n=1 Tax=Holothuria leucospilota TaxID=206669 RepID=A0A9Q0YN64_HOLLE|nr:hypothetical protein HOLleu_33125 [Holothuria leucospilota]
MRYGERKNPIVFGGGQVHLGSPGSTWKSKIVIWGHQRSKCKISQEFSRSNMNTKLYFFNTFR